ncbi:MAG TPA: hypothetical protein VIM55_10105 [Mucilaginibacter sp.]
MAYIKYIPLLLLSLPAKAQLFGQANAQVKYYEQQIAAYHALQSEIKQGYNVCKNGLNGIASINTAELNAHTAYCTALKIPSPAVKNSSQVKDILNYQAYINRAFSQTFEGLNTDEANYETAVKNQVFDGCNKDLVDLQNLLAANKLQLSDDERLKRLNAIHASMLEKYQFSQSFTNSLKILALRRQQESNDANTLTNLYANH